ncbi:MAG: hypothetical protein WCC48_10855 [Anaeromyxobacteraceae bacterium]
MDDRDRLLDALEREVRLEAARVNGTTSKVVTPSLTRVVSETLSRSGLTVQLEYPMPYDGHRGRVDVVALSPTTGALQIAVEIDIGFKLKSLRKLEGATRAGARAFWLRWGEFAPWESSRVPAEIRRVEVPITVPVSNAADLRTIRRRERANAAEAAALKGAPRPPAETWEQGWSRTLARVGLCRVGGAYDFAP